MSKTFEIRYYSKNDASVKTELVIANSKQELLKEVLLYRQNVILIDIKEKSQFLLKLFTYRKISLKELSDFCFAIGKSLQIGLDIISTLEDLSETVENKSFKTVLLRIADDLKNGKSLYESMSSYGIFPVTMLTMIKIGEKTGDLYNSFLNYGDYVEWLIKLRGSIKKAMAYPIVAGFSISIALMVLVVFVLPKIVKAIKMLGLKSIPLPTQIISYISEHGSSVFIMIGVIIGFLFILKIMRNFSEKITYWTDFLILKIPKIGDLILQKHLAEDLKAINDIYKAGGAIIEALELVYKEMEKNFFLKEKFKQIYQEVISGSSLYEAFSSVDVFPRLVLRTIRIGEESGDINESLERVIELYETNLKTAIENLTLIIEPAMQVVLGGMLALIAAGVLMPVYQIVSQLGAQ